MTPTSHRVAAAWDSLQTDAAVNAFNAHEPTSPYTLAMGGYLECRGCGRFALSSTEQFRHRVAEALDAARQVAAAPATADEASSSAPGAAAVADPHALAALALAPQHERVPLRPAGRTVQVHFAVFAGDGTDDQLDRDPIGERTLQFPLEIVDRVADPRQQLLQHVTWRRWSAEVREALTLILAPCDTCGGASLCPGCAGAAHLFGVSCVTCDGTGRCPACTDTTVGIRIRFEPNEPTVEERAERLVTIFRGSVSRLEDGVDYLAGQPGRAKDRQAYLRAAEIARGRSEKSGPASSAGGGQ
ncbi:hypothetical protein [Cryptosporangium sp. NPDC051539]|uniref:hypothetical protein n=1 Tax=Cryptosporangium sp. NPDC051539 TaxID=3363962 RepID=UPI0037A68996